MANEQQQAQPAQPQQEAQAPAPIQQQNNAVQAFNPLKGINLSQQLMPYANALAAPFESYMECFQNKQEGYASWHREIEYVTQMLTAPGKPADFLRQCFMSNPLALVNAVKQVPMTGLTLNPNMRLSYLVPFKSVVTFFPSYAGLREIAVRSGLCSKLEAHLVYKDDEFEIEFGENEHLVHKPNPWGAKSQANMVGGYWYAVLADGTKLFDTMSLEELNKVRSTSPSGNNGPWASYEGEMYKKTLIRRAFKSLPRTGISDDKLKVIDAVAKADDGFFYDETTTPKKKPVRNDFFEEMQPVDAQFEMTNENPQQ